MLRDLNDHRYARQKHAKPLLRRPLFDGDRRFVAGGAGRKPYRNG
jgi:hypothetical protein